MRRLLPTLPFSPTALAALATACALGAPVRAHGTLPTSNSIAFGPGDGGVFLGTNFGGIVRQSDGVLRFVCELLVTGEQQSIDHWLWLGSGAIAGAVTQGGLIRGVFASDPSTCAYGTVPGTEPYLIADLVADPADPAAFYAVGQSDDAAVLLHGRPGEGAEVVIERAGAAAGGVRAAGDRIVATFEAGGEAHVVDIDVSGLAGHAHPLAAGEHLRPLGLDPGGRGGPVWLTRSSETAEVVLRSTDRGETLDDVLTLDSRIGGFAARGETVWVQGARAGVYRSDDGGERFEPVAGSPHGSCLAFAPDGDLFACGVPWQDGFALGSSADGTRFLAEIPYFDGIVGAVACPDAPAATTTCEGELQFLREYYGFADPGNVAEGGPEAEAAEIVEPAPEAEPEVAEAAVEPASKPRDDGCAGGCAGGMSGAFALALFFALRARRRR